MQFSILMGPVPLLEREYLNRISENKIYYLDLLEYSDLCLLCAKKATIVPPGLMLRKEDILSMCPTCNGNVDSKENDKELIELRYEVSTLKKEIMRLKDDNYILDNKVKKLTHILKTSNNQSKFIK